MELARYSEVPGVPAGQARHEVDDDLGVAECVWKIEPCASSSARSSSALTRLPLWATATAPPAYSTASGWAFLTWRRAGGGVADVADGGAPREPLQDRGGEDVRHQPHVAVDVERLARRVDDDARGLLAAVLEGVEPQVGEVGRFLDWPSAQMPKTPHSSFILS